MGSLFRGNKLIEQYEAFSVLASGCRQLAQTCVTEGAKAMLCNLADELEQGAGERDLQDLVQSSFAHSLRAPAAYG